MNYEERGVVFTRGSDRLVGIATMPENPRSTAVLFLVGGPQYRAGSHRQFTLLARSLACKGYGSFRFDYAGMGDSEGERAAFESTLDDIRSAIVALQVNVPNASRVVLWGLCDAASAAMLHGYKLADVRGMILANPWVHGGEYTPGFRLSHYYRPLLRERAAWKRLFRGEVDLKPALSDAVRAITGAKSGNAARGSQDFVKGMLEGLQSFDYARLFLLSDNDLTAREFRALTEADRRWSRELASTLSKTVLIADSDHTFSTTKWRDEVALHTIEYLDSLTSNDA